MSTTSDNAGKVASLLTLVQGANTGLLLWNVVGPFVQAMIERGTIPNVPVTQDDLAQASVDLGRDLDTLQVAIDNRKKREDSDQG